ncbi:MAG: amidohydrolase family protein [Solirubrobacteraceae bacterium]|nr:amidohydrolase family protein [Solirubrobacteraceae bacterium]
MPPDLVIRNVRRRGAPQIVDVAVASGRIVAVGADLPQVGAEELDGAGALLLPGFVCGHLHLDKAMLADELRPASWHGDRQALRAVNERQRETFTEEDLLARAAQAVELAISHGTTHLRAFTDVEPVAGLLGTRALVELRRRYAAEIDIQVAVHPQDLIFAARDNSELLAAAAREGADVIGGMPSEERTPQLVQRHVDFVLDLAKQHGCAVHMFVDDSDDPADRALEYLAWRTIQEGMQGRVTAGHCGAMSAYDDAHARRVIGLVAEAGITICVNSHISLNLRGRLDRGLVRRGTTRVAELAAAGVNLMAAQDDLDNPFYPLGRGDPLEVAHYAAHVLQLLWPEQLEDVFDMVTVNGARALGVERYGTEVGDDANLVLLAHPTLREALAAMPPPRAVISKGVVRAEHEIRSVRRRAVGEPLTTS